LKSYAQGLYVKLEQRAGKFTTTLTVWHTDTTTTLIDRDESLLSREREGGGLPPATSNNWLTGPVYNKTLTLRPVDYQLLDTIDSTLRYYSIVPRAK